jgi:hypothetical protein
MPATIAVSERGFPVTALRRLARRTKNNAALTILLLLREKAGDDGRVSITREEIMRHTGLSTTGVTNAIAVLAEAALLEHVHVAGPIRCYTLRLLNIPERDERPIASALA